MTNPPGHVTQPSQHSYHQQPRQVATETGGMAGGAQNAGQTGQQPVEFNHAINYVNKIKVGGVCTTA